MTDWRGDVAGVYFVAVNMRCFELWLWLWCGCDRGKLVLAEEGTRRRIYRYVKAGISYLRRLTMFYSLTVIILGLGLYHKFNPICTAVKSVLQSKT